MREALKQILAGRGTPVLQTRQADGEETILSAGNIWTSAHARRIELRDRGLAPGAVLCREVGGFGTAVDFVACAIGGFIFLPVSRSGLRSLQRQAAADPVASRTGIAFADGAGLWQHLPDRLPADLAVAEGRSGAAMILRDDPAAPAAGVSILGGSEIEARLDRLSARWATPEQGTRLSYRPDHDGSGFLGDVLLGMRHRQTIYLRGGAASCPAEMLGEILALEVDDLVLAPSKLDSLCREARRLGASDRAALGRVRCHTTGRTLSPRRREAASQLFGAVFAAG